MCTKLSPKVPSINQFLAMTTAEIFELPVHKCPPSELYKVNHPVVNQILALKFFINQFSNSAERVQLCNIVVPKLKESLCELLQSSQLDTICSLINSVSLVICDTVDSTSDDPSEVLQSLAISVLDLLLQFYKLIFERRENDVESERLNNIVECVNVIRAKLLEHLKLNEANYLPEDLTRNDVNFVNRVTLLLCEMAEFAFKSEDPAFLTAVWRCIFTICMGKLPKSIARFAASDNESICFEYLLSVVKTGCFGIQSGLDGMRESSSEQTAKFHYKAIPFITNVFQRLTAVYSHDKFRGHHHVLTTLLTMMRSIRTVSQPDAFFNQDLVSGLRNVLLQIYKSDEFVQSFRRISSAEFSIDLLTVGLDLSNKLLESSTDSEAFRHFMKNENMNIIDKMVECMAADPLSIFDQNHEAYRNTIKTLSSILIKCSAPASTVSPNVVPRLLVKNVLQCNDILSGYIWMDLWNAWMRCLSEEQCYTLILFWSEIYAKNSLVVQSSHLTSVHAKILLLNLYDSLSDGYRSKLCTDKRVFNNTKFWASLGPRRSERDANEVTNIHSKIDELLRAFSTDRTDAAFYKLVEHLRLSETITPQSNATSVPNHLLELWNLNLNHRPKKYSPLIVRLLRISFTYQRSLTNSQHLLILQKISAIFNAPSVTILLRLEILHYLRHAAINYFTVEHQRDILQLIRQLFNKGFTDPDPIVRKTAFISYARVISEIKHDDIRPDNIANDTNVKMELFNLMQPSAMNSNQCRGDHQIKFLRELGSYSMQHDCTAKVMLQTSDEALVDCHSNEIRAKEIIERMREDARELVALNRRFGLTDELCKKLAEVRQELASLE